jgi:zinc transporter ZupT
MMDEIVFPIIVLSLAVILSFLHYFSHKFSSFIKKHHYKGLSLSGGTLIAIIFLILLPEISMFENIAPIYLMMLLGFSIFYMGEKYLYQHVKNKKDMLDDLKEMHTLGFFIDHFILGFVLVTTLDLEKSFGYLIFFPIFLHTVSSSIALDHIDKRAKTKLKKIVLSSSPLIGAIVALIFEIRETILAVSLSLILGMLLYIVNRDILPGGKRGHPKMFILGVSIVVAIWVIITIFG